MDASTLGLREDMRFWHIAGLRHVLADKDIAELDISNRASGSLSEQQVASGVPSQSGTSGPTGFKQPSKASVLARSADAQQDTASDTNSASQPSSESHREEHRLNASPGKQSAPSTSPSSSKEAPATLSAANTESLAVFPWDEFRPKLIVPSRTVWTYWELCTDFGPTPNAERRELFKKIIHFLKWPRNSVSFWPLSFEHQDVYIANKGNFLRGVRETGAHTIVCFGEKAFKVLFPRQRFTFSRLDLSGLSVVTLPGPEEMLSGDQQSKRIVWDTLRTIRL